MADGPPAHDDHGQALAAAARLHATGDSAGALELLPDLVAARPDDGAVRLLLARCLATAGTPAVALAAADAAVACDPGSWQAHAVLAHAALPIDPERAAAAADRAVALAPAEPEAHRAQAVVREAATESPIAEDGTRRRPGGISAALGLRVPTPTVTPIPADEPRLTPRLPAALAGQAPAPSAPTAPPAAPVVRAEPAIPSAGTAPTTRATTGPAGPAAEALGGRREPPVPRNLGGAGLAGTATTPGAGGDEAATGDGEDQVGRGRLALRVAGLGLWLLIGFQVGVRGIGGPIGIGIFVACLAIVGVLARQVGRR